MTATEQLQALRDHEAKLRLAWEIAKGPNGTRTDIPRIIKALLGVRKQILELSVTVEATE